MNSFLNQVAQNLLERFGRDLHKTAIIFNNKRPIPFLKMHLGKLAGKANWSPAFFTVQEFFRESTTLTVAEPLSQFFTLHQEYNKILKVEGKKEVSPDAFFPMAEIILSDFSQLDYDLVNPDEVFLQLKNIALIQQQFPHFTPEQQQFLEQFWTTFSGEKQHNHQQKFIDLWAIMPKLYTAFHEALKEKNLVTTAQVYRKLANDEAENPGFVEPFHKLIFVGFNALNRAESKLFKRWQDEERALFYFDTDPYYLDDKTQEAGLFLRRNLEKTGLVNQLTTNSGQVSGIRPELSTINHELSAISYQPTAISTKTIHIIETIGHAAQAKAISPFFADEMSTADDSNPEKIAIILADENLLIPVLQTLPAGDAKVNVTMGYPLAQSTVFGLVEIWLAVQEQVQNEGKDSIYYRDVEAFLSHPLIGVTQTERDGIQKMIHENSLIEVPLTALHFATALSPNFFTVKHGGLASIDALYILLTAVLEQRQRQGNLQQLEASLLIEVCRVLNQLYDSLAAYAENLSLIFVFSLVRKALRGLSVPLEGEPLKGIQVMGLLESRCLDFENLIILGTNEGILPKTSLTSTFIPDSLRRAYGLPVLENQDAISAYLFYRLLQRSNKISVVYNSLVDESNSGERSRFLKQLEFESGFKFEYHRQQQPVQVGQVMPILVPKKGRIWQAMQKFFIDRGKWDDEKISATGLTTYLSCRLQFFFRYIAKIKEPEEMPDQLEANKVGTLLHQVLEWFYQQLNVEDANVTSESIQAKMDEVPFLCRQALSQLLFGKGKKDQLKKPNAMQSIILKIVEEYAFTLIKHDAEEAAPFRIVELENKKDYRLAFPINVSGEVKKVNLYGIIDRVDEQNGKLRIVDYKSGSRDDLRYHSLTELFERGGKKQNKAMLQTLFYTHIYEQVKGQPNVSPNLYIIRKLKDGTQFFTGTGKTKMMLEANSLNEMKAGFETELRTILEDIFNPEIGFNQTEDLKTCSYCPYKEICQR